MRPSKKLLLTLSLSIFFVLNLSSQLSVYEVDSLYQNIAFNTLSSNSSSALTTRIASDNIGKGKIDFKTLVASGDSLIQNLQSLLSGGGNFMLEYSIPIYSPLSDNNLLVSILSETKAAYSPSITGNNQIFNVSTNLTARGIIKSSNGDFIISPNASFVLMAGNDAFINVFEDATNQDSFLMYQHFEVSIIIGETFLLGASFTTNLFGEDTLSIPVDVTLSYKI